LLKVISFEPLGHFFEASKLSAFVFESTQIFVTEETGPAAIAETPKSATPRASPIIATC
jgi:hypothetical protein